MVSFNVTFQETDTQFDVEVGQVTVLSNGTSFVTDETLTLKNGVLSVNRAEEPEPNNTLPITAAGVYSTVGNIEILLGTI